MKLSHITPFGRFVNPSTGNPVNVKRGRDKQRGVEVLFYLLNGKRVYIPDSAFWSLWKEVKSMPKEGHAAKCPFCGSKATVTEGWGAPAGVGSAWCVTISCSGISQVKSRCSIIPQLQVSETNEKKRGELRKKAIKIWNKRF